MYVGSHGEGTARPSPHLVFHAGPIRSHRRTLLPKPRPRASDSGNCQWCGPSGAILARRLEDHFQPTEREILYMQQIYVRHLYSMLTRATPHQPAAHRHCPLARCDPANCNEKRRIARHCGLHRQGGTQAKCLVVKSLCTVPTGSRIFAGSCHRLLRLSASGVPGPRRSLSMHTT